MAPAAGEQRRRPPTQPRHPPLRPQLVLRQVLPLLHDSNPRVRWSALHFVGRLATHFRGAVQSEFSHVVMPALIQALDDPAGQRLTVRLRALPCQPTPSCATRHLAHAGPAQSHAVVAISHMLDDTNQEHVVPVLDELVRRLTGLMSTQSPTLLEDVISCVSSLAIAADAKFTPYYKVFMPPLLRNFASLVVRAPLAAAGAPRGPTPHALRQKPDDVRLRARVLECISLIGTAVGPDHFTDAKDVMRMTLSIAASPEQWQDPIRSHVLQSWGRIGSSMREAAAEFLPAVVPVLLHIGQQSVQEVAPSATDLMACALPARVLHPSWSRSTATGGGGSPSSQCPHPSPLFCEQLTRTTRTRRTAWRCTPLKTALCA